MNLANLPIITSNKKFRDMISKILDATLDTKINAPMISGRKESIEYLNVNLPDLFILDISDKSNEPFGFLDDVIKDPWLLHGGIIAIASDYSDTKKLDEYAGANIIITLNDNEVKNQLHKVIQIVKNNSNILIQRAIGSDFIGNMSGSFIMNNDTIEVICYTNLICNFMHNTNRITAQEKTKLNITINELLLNAVEHGNCGISYKEKGDWLDKGKNIGDLIDMKNSDSDISKRKVLFEFMIKDKSSHFLISDEGEGFDWRKNRETKIENTLMELHGRGIIMARNLSNSLEYNDKGNEVKFSINHSINNNSMAPSIFKGVSEVKLNSDELVFKQGDSSDTLYYIVKGEFEVIANNIKVATLSPNDIFLGEMSFLLNNRRSATIKSKTGGVLMPISRTEFVHEIKKSPHYALFLSRILAQRLERLNKKVFGG